MTAVYFLYGSCVVVLVIEAVWAIKGVNKNGNH